MGFFDKLFGKNDSNMAEDEPTMGIFEPQFSHKDFGRTIVVGKFNKKKDPSKEIKKEVWYGLNESARNELKSKGFYCEDDEIDVDDDNFRVIQS